MDQSSFDRIARLLGSSGATTRRQGIAAAIGTAIGAALGLPALDADAKNHGKDKDKGKSRKPKPEGPCGDGSRKDNACTKDSQCCTGLCNKKIGKKNLDGKGRCRCLRRGKKCKTTSNCCKHLTCSDGVCGGGPTPPTPIPTGQPCVQDVDTCADSYASCTTYESGTPAGTYCLLPRGAACTADTQCEPGTCDSGVCASCNCGACSASCDAPTVCATCTHTTIQSAVTAATAGDTITIAAGSYSEDVTIDKNLNLKGCGAVTVTNNTYGKRSIEITNEAVVEIIDLIVDGYNDSSSSQDGGGIKSDGTLYLCRNTVVRNGRWSGSNQGGGVFLAKNSSKNGALYVFDQTIIENNVTDTYGGGVYIDSYNMADIAHGAIIRNNAADYGGGVSFYYTDKVQKIRNSALIHGNSATSQGGGIDIYDRGAPGFDLQISGKVKLTNNTTQGNGGAIAGAGADFQDLEYVTITGAVEISGNHADSYGGGIYTNGHVFTIGDTVRITGNSAMHGGGVATSNPGGSGGQFTSGFYVLTINGSVVVDGNTADSYGGGISNSDNPIHITGNATISNNSASAGGGVQSYGYPLLIDGNVRITGNTAKVGTNYAGDGAALFLSETTLPTTIGGTVVISGNIADNWGGGIVLYDSSSYPVPVVFEAGTSVTGNTANGGPGSGGGIYSEDNNPSTTVTGGSVVTGNTPDNCAGVTC